MFRMTDSFFQAFDMHSIWNNINIAELCNMHDS